MPSRTGERVATSSLRLSVRDRPEARGYGRSAQQAEQAAQQAQAAAKQPDDNGNKPANESIAGDPVEAYKWAVVARETAKTDKTKSAQVYRANRLLRQLAKKMNAEQVKQAEEAAQAFLNK